MKNRTIRNRIFRKMTAALLAAVLTLSAAQGLVASEDSEQVQEQAEPAAKQCGRPVWYRHGNCGVGI